MISSAMSLGGLSTAELSALFAPTASSSSSAATTAPPASTGTSISAGNDPAKAIQAILAEVRVTRAEVVSGSQTAVSTTVEEAYAAQSSDGSVTSAAAISIFADTADHTKTNVTAQWSTQAVDHDIWGTSSMSESITSLSSSAPGAPDDPSQDTTVFKISSTLNNVTIGIEFSVAGLGRINDIDGLTTFGQSLTPGGTTETTQFDVMGGGTGAVTLDLNLDGLDSAKAHQINDAFNQAVSALDLDPIRKTGYVLNAEAGPIQQVNGPVQLSS